MSTTLGSSVKREICNLTPGDNNHNGGPDTATKKTSDNEQQTSDASCKRPRSTESHCTRVCVHCPCVACVPPWPRRARMIGRPGGCSPRLPHLAAIRMCASSTAVKQQKCVAQMERRGWRAESRGDGYAETVQNVEARRCQTANDLVGVGRRQRRTKGGW